MNSEREQTQQKRAESIDFVRLWREICVFFAVGSTRLAIFGLICTLSVGISVAQNEPQFSGAFAMPTVVNPAAAGRSGLLEVGAAFRQQWVGFDDSPSNFLLSVDSEMKFLKNFHGVGVVVLQDKVGPQTVLDMGANYSYHIYLNDGILGLGLRAGARNVKYEAGELTTAVPGMTDDYHQETDAVLQSVDDSQTAFDVGLGGFYQTEKCYLSLSFLHLTSPELEMKNGARYKVRPFMTFGAGMIMGKYIKDKALEPRVNLKTDFASMQIEMSLNAIIKQKVWFGLGWRLQDALLVGAGVRLPMGLDLSYNYDVSLSSLRRYNSGSHELSARYQLNLDRERATKTYKSVRIL